MNAATQFYSLSYKQAKTYLIAVILTVGNILLPWLCHLIPQGGLIFLPIYFFTLFGAYKYGIRAGLLIAFLSPVINYLLTGMPSVAMLTVVIVKSCLLAISAAYAAKHFRKVSIIILTGVVLFYQFTGTFFEWVLLGDFHRIIQGLRLSVQGMLIQVLGAYGMLKLMAKYEYKFNLK
jgi:hypothetical protein